MKTANITTRICARYLSILASVVLLALTCTGCAGVQTYKIELHPVIMDTPSAKYGHGEKILVAMATDNRADDLNMFAPNSYLLIPSLNDDGDNYGDMGQFGLEKQANLIFENQDAFPKSVSTAVVDTLNTYGYNAVCMDPKKMGNMDGPTIKVLYPSVERLHCLRVPGTWSIQDYGTSVLGFSIKQPGDSRVIWSTSVTSHSNRGSVMMSGIGDLETAINDAFVASLKEFGEKTRTAGFRNALLNDENTRLVDISKP